jgi:hypothetical protein
MTKYVVYIRCFSLHVAGGASIIKEINVILSTVIQNLLFVKDSLMVKLSESLVKNNILCSVCVYSKINDLQSNFSVKNCNSTSHGLFVTEAFIHIIL